MTNDLTQCKTCVFYYTDEAGNDMCMQVGDDFYLQWKVKHCPKYRSGSLATLINKLESENAELRARLERAVELPCKKGDKIYLIVSNCFDCKNRKYVCYKSGKNKGRFKGYFYCQELKTDNFIQNTNSFICKNGDYRITEDKFDLISYRAEIFCYNNFYKNFNKTWFTIRAAAEARLAELKGDKNDQSAKKDN